MKILIISLSLLQVSNGTSKQEVKEVLRSYIQWTSTGKSERVFFDENTLLTCPGVNRNENELFKDYKVKIENAASSIAREMSIKSIQVKGGIAKAEIEDCSEAHYFSLVHHVTLKNTNDQWKIDSIKIVGKI